ncbi:hypothetical protein FRC17_007796 [Serendipita sp. 399]|nr:hypothetical protein FRC17_007796 [Serendipita sp. 399]
MPSTERNRSQTAGFDVFGVSLFTVAVILFSVAVTSGPTQGWATPHVLAPLLISISLATVFFFWESRIPFEDAVLPPRMWRYPNFGIIVILALVPVFWWVTSFISLTSWWETVYGWSAVKTAVHTLPMGITAWLISYVAARLPSYFSHRAILISGLLLAIPATALLSFANAPETYWRFAFPAFVVGSIGMMIVLVNGSIAIFASTPPSSAGTVGAVYNSALKLGSAIGLAAVQSITISIDQRNSGSLKIPVVEWSQHVDQITKPMWELAFRGRAASYWFILAILGLQLVAVIVFFKKDVPDYHHEQNTRAKQDVEAGITGVEEKD